ncbi:DNA repair and recombination protein RAD54B-like [Phlebotomus argentipes]|uniref:DNA repair and recombination protein RAD54B-like n=1 Tax=Phlebotomus argentipes TaxID=94469 RepID=UPI002892BBA0|nr:DNA repair and recombination protein RAD54B-like [Phlebotomus argentipes]
MRRSSAPSMKRQCGESAGRREGNSSKFVKVTVERERVNVGPLRDFQMLGKQDDPDAPVPVNASVERKYSVLWNRPNTKKHKTWEGDGVLEITENTVYLRNSDGSILTSMPIPSKDVTFEEGMRLTVGSKEVEIVEEIGEVEVKEEKPVMPVKSQPIVRKVEKLGGLLLPDPPQEHQRIFNREQKPLTPVRVVESVAKHLRPHQKEGIIFLYESLMGFHNPEAEFHGAVLADEMGLGKSLQVIATCFTLLRQGPYARRNIARKILIVCPSSLVENWSREVGKWLGEERIYAFVVDGKHKVKDFSVSATMPFIILSYEMVVTQLNDLQDMIFDVMVCDEGHRLKNSDTRIVKLLTQMDCKRRIILTGTPIQNDLHEFFCLVSFVQPDILGSYTEYRIKYETPIVNSQVPGADSEVQALGHEKVQELNDITDKVILRRTQLVNREYLPEKEEVVVFCKATEIQDFLQERLVSSYETEEVNRMSPFKVISLLRKICNHPALLETIEAQEGLVCVLQEFLPPTGDMGPRDSGKLSVLEGLLAELRGTGERIVVVSHSTKALDMIEGLCRYFNHVYCRLDGSTSSSDRQRIVDRFNSPSSDAFVFLLSAKAGGTGLNLIGASRLVLFDADWNPATDLQAMSRIWRDGQTRNVVIYRLVTAGSIEERIFQRQIAKNALSVFVSDSSKDSVSFSEAELRDIFSAPMSGVCLTHEALQCMCGGSGNVPEPQEATAGCQMGQMSHLMQWEHHSGPINQQVLKELSLEQNGDEILYLFRNRAVK